MFTNIKLLLNSLATFLPFTIVASADDGLHTHHQRLVREGDGFASRIWILGVRTCFFFLLAVAANAFGQATDNWIFGHHAWINVKGNTAVGVTTMIPPLSTGEGSSSISDNNGNLLFYTDGKTVWNRLHQPMAAPTLSGNPSSTNSALIVPCSCNQYFVFTTDAAENRYEKGLNYSVVDMTLNAGLGGVIPTRTNIPLLANSTEKLAATTATGGGFWLVGHHLLNNEFHAWHILANSDNCEHLELQQAVISKVGTDYNSNSSHYGQGQMKFSPNGTRLAVAGLAFNGSFVEVFQFSKATGVVSDIFLGGTTQDTLPVVYGVEFSPDGSKLYVTTLFAGPAIYQYAAVNTLGSRTIVAKSFPDSADPNYQVGALQLATNGNIYIARRGLNYLSALTTPNINPTYQQIAVTLPGASKSELGLPAMIAGTFACDAGPDPCCPPWNSSIFQDTMIYSGLGGIGADFTLKFKPTPTLKTQMKAYVAYLRTVNPAIMSANIDFSLYNAGSGTDPIMPIPVGAPPLGSGGLATWKFASTPITTPPKFFADSLMQVNVWYTVRSRIFLNDNLTFFPERCSNNDFHIRLQVRSAAARTVSQPVLQIRTMDGRIIEKPLSEQN